MGFPSTPIVMEVPLPTEPEVSTARSEALEQAVSAQRATFRLVFVLS